jgi:hypothetical protein
MATNGKRKKTSATEDSGKGTVIVTGSARGMYENSNSATDFGIQLIQLQWKSNCNLISRGRI